MSEITNVGVNIAEKSAVIWNVANHLFGYFKPHEYGLVILPMTVVKRFRDYLAGFSGNVQDVLSKFDFDNVIKRMVESNTLYLVIKEFNRAKGYLGPDKISAVDCGYIFEDLVRRFNESYGEEAGAHFTSRDIIYLMTDLLLTDTRFNGETITVYENCTTSLIRVAAA